MDSGEQLGWEAVLDVVLGRDHDELCRLLDNGFDVNAQDVDGETLLMNACIYGYIDTARLLLDRGANVSLRDWDGWTALMIASGNGHAEMAGLLLERGADVNMQSDLGWTALMFASGRGREAVVSLLLDRGAEVNLRRGDGATALTLANRPDGDDHYNVIRFLLVQGADPGPCTADVGGLYRSLFEWPIHEALEEATGVSMDDGHCGIARLVIDYLAPR